MTRHEPEAYGDDVRDVLDGLRRLARETETPSELLPEILARGEQLLPPPPAPRARWWQRLTAAWRRPPVWAPAMGVACILLGFGAGIRMSPRVTMHADGPDVRSNTPAQSAASVEVAEDVAAPSPPAAFAPVSRPSSLVQKKTFFESRRAERAAPRHTDIAPAPAQREKVAKTLSAPHVTPSSGVTPSREVRLTLPANLYEELRQQAHRRGKPLADILREAIDAYLQDTSTAETEERTK